MAAPSDKPEEDGRSGKSDEEEIDDEEIPEEEDVEDGRSGAKSDPPSFGLSSEPLANCADSWSASPCGLRCLLSDVAS